jgi:hypothetical protein
MAASLLRCLPCALASLLLLACGAAPALARDGGVGDIRVAGTCAKGAASKLRLRSRDGTIRVEFELTRRHPRERWRLVLVHERRVSWRGSARTSSGGSLRLRRSLDDLSGADRVTVRAGGPNGLSCEATATLAG